jgi:hypothetical protein
MFLFGPTLTTKLRGLFSSCFLDGFKINFSSKIPTLIDPSEHKNIKL